MLLLPLPPPMLLDCLPAVACCCLARLRNGGAATTKSHSALLCVQGASLLYESFVRPFLLVAVEKVGCMIVH